MQAILNWLRQLDMDWLITTAITVAAALLCITFHETCHGFAAYKLGDTTAKRAGRLSLNPLRHIDLAGLLMMAVCKFGWAKPVPVDMRNFKNPKRDMALTALAGPLSNVLLAAVALFLCGIFYFFYEKTQSGVLIYVFIFFQYVAVLSAGLAVFNIFPIPPLDGSKVLYAFLPQDKYYMLMRYERYGMIVLVIALFSGLLNTPLAFLRDGLLSVLNYCMVFPYELLAKFFY